MVAWVGGWVSQGHNHIPPDHIPDGTVIRANAGWVGVGGCGGWVSWADGMEIGGCWLVGVCWVGGGKKNRHVIRLL